MLHVAILGISTGRDHKQNKKKIEIIFYTNSDTNLTEKVRLYCYLILAYFSVVCRTI